MGCHFKPRPKDLLNEYSKRTLSYDSDTLNACAGMLNTVCNHYFGMPIQKDPDYDTYDLRLHWYNSSPGQSRKGFPSWSWAGSTGEKHGVGVYMSDAYLPRCYEILIPLKNGWQTVDAYIKSQVEALPTAPGPTLCVKGRLVTASFADHTWVRGNQPHVQDTMDLQGRKRPLAILSHPYHMEIGIPILLDTEQDHVDEMVGARALIIENGFGSSGLHPRWVVLLILKPIGDYYRRIGIAWFGGYNFFRRRTKLAYVEEEPFWHQQSERETIYLV
ncbi:hypothetical protein IQ07DRAFT_117423 [Pyrenochaeta sp. DS3sAY3a]|nr:hypothetical protein IQ07DRAFT_117423 [Pyrenochaeta sp. DS3sAY3a]